MLTMQNDAIIATTEGTVVSKAAAMLAIMKGKAAPTTVPRGGAPE
jgi:hypothetical protein